MRRVKRSVGVYSRESFWMVDVIYPAENLDGVSVGESIMRRYRNELRVNWELLPMDPYEFKRGLLSIGEGR